MQIKSHSVDVYKIVAYKKAGNKKKGVAIYWGWEIVYRVEGGFKVSAHYIYKASFYKKNATLQAKISHQTVSKKQPIKHWTNLILTYLVRVLVTPLKCLKNNF